MLSKPEIIYEYSHFPELKFMANNKYSAKHNGSEKKLNGSKTGNSNGRIEGLKTYFEQIFDNRNEAILILDENDLIMNLNRGFENMFHYSKDDVIGKSTLEIIVPENLINESKDILNKLESGIDVKKETVRLRKDGHFVNVQITGNSLDLGNNRKGKFIIYNDISSHKKSEEQIKASLMEKEVLLKEIHHRVKNNLQVVASLLYLQSRKIKDKQIESMFLNCQNRVKSISLIHEKLYQTNDLARVDFDKYIKSLIYHLFNSFSVKSNQIALSIKSENIFMTMDTAIPCGLIINELVTNSLKHAFPSNRKGEIAIEMQYHTNNKFTLCVRDNGIGLPKDFDYTESDSLGFLLVQNLVKQLEASMDVNTDNGTEYKIVFSILNHKGGGE